MNPVVVKIRSLAASERKITAEVLECIREIEKKGIHLGMGYPNLVVFLVKECCYSETAALRRIAAARLVQEIPKMGEELKKGNLSLSHVSIVAQGVKQKERDSEVSIETKEQILDAVMGKSSVEAQKITAQVLDLPKIVKEKVIVHGDDTQTLQMNFSKEELELFERAKEVMGHIQPGMSKKEVVVEGLKMILKYRDPARTVRQRATAMVLKSVKKEGAGEDVSEKENSNCNWDKKNLSQQNPKAGPVLDRNSQESTQDTSVVAPRGEHEKTRFLNEDNGCIGSCGQIEGGLQREKTLEGVKSGEINGIVIGDRESSVNYVEQIKTGEKCSADINGAAEVRGNFRSKDFLCEGSGVGETIGPAIREADSGVGGSVGPATGMADSGVEVRGAKVAIPAQVRRAIFQRDQCCQWKNASGRMCESRHLLEVDHVRPRWAGGGNEIENLRLLCRAHNQYRNTLSL